MNNPVIEPIQFAWLRGGLTMSLSLHLLAVLLLLGLSLIALSENFKRDPDSQDMLLNISRKLVYIIGLSLALGLPTIGFLLALKSQSFLASAKLLAPGWILAAALAALGYGAAYLYYAGFSSLSNRGRLLYSALSSFSFLVVALIFMNCVGLMREQFNPFWAQDRAHAWQLLKTEPLIWLKFLHLISAALMLGGLAIAAYNEWRRRTVAAGDFGGRIALGLRWYIWAGLITVALGVVNLHFSPLGQLFVGGSPFATGLLFVGLTVAILGLIAAIRGHVLNCLLISLITLSCMVLIRELATMASLNLWPSAVGFSLMGLGQLILLAGAAALVWRYFAAPRL